MSLIDTLYSSLSDPYLIPAMANGLLESEGKDPKAVAMDFAANCLDLAKRGDASKMRVPLLEWLINIVQTRGEYSIAFFGRSVYGGAGCGTSDIECVVFLLDRDIGAEYRFSPKPGDVTLLKVYDSTHALPGCPEHDLPYLFAGPALLYPSAPHPFAIRRIESAKQYFGGKDDEDGLMARITHAASKVLNNQELALFDSSAIASRFIGRSLIRRDAERGIDFGEKTCIFDAHYAYEKQLMAIPADDLAALAKAAMKRVRVKEEHRERLAKRYIDRLMRYK